MKLVRIEFDEDAKITMSMTPDELALIYRLTGHISSARITDAARGAKWAEVLADVASGSASVFNMLYENGVDEVLPRFDLFES
jgi:hypothetical protein